MGWQILKDFNEKQKLSLPGISPVWHWGSFFSVNVIVKLLSNTWVTAGNVLLKIPSSSVHCRIMC